MQLQDIRREYLKGGLRREDLDVDPIIQLENWLLDATRCEIFDRTAMTLATVDACGQPSQRVVLLKQLDPRGLVFYTNLESAKAKDIAINPKVSANFSWLALERQVKIEGVARQISSLEAMQYFISRPKDSQIAAWASQQSQPVKSRAILLQAFEQIKRKFGQGEIPLPDFWGGFRIEPTKIEFWQGGGARLHDRFVYRRDNSSWLIERLAP